MSSNYAGYLIKINGVNGGSDYIIDTAKYIKADSYKTSVKPIDLDSYTDGYGTLHRNVLTHKPTKTEFETREMLTNAEMSELMSNITSRYIIAKERKMSVTVFVPEWDGSSTSCYWTQDMYLVDPEFQMYGNYHGVIHYRPVRLCFIAY